MGHHENKCPELYRNSNVLSYPCYLDDTFCLFNSEKDATLFFNCIKTQHPDIHFSMEWEKDQSITPTLFDNGSRRICKLVNQLSYSIDKFNWLRLEKENTVKEHPVLASNIYLFPYSQMVLFARDNVALLGRKLAVCLLVAYFAERCQIVHQS